MEKTIKGHQKVKIKDQDSITLFRSDVAGLLFAPCPKCASTTIIDWLGRISLALGSERPSLAAPHGKRSQYLRSGVLSKEVIPVAGFQEYLIGKSGYTLFCATRNPFKRIVSAHADKINRYCKYFERKLYYAGKLHQIFSGPSSWLTNKAANQFMASQFSLRELLLGMKVNGVDFDDHFKPQSKVLFPHRVDYEYVLKVEELSAGLGSLLNQRGLSASLADSITPGRLNSTRTKLSAKANCSTHSLPVRDIDTEMAAIIRDLYAADFENFDYDLCLH